MKREDGPRLLGIPEGCDSLTDSERYVPGTQSLSGGMSAGEVDVLWGSIGIVVVFP